MNTPFKQQGLSMLAWLVILFTVSIFVTCAVKLSPLYLDAWTVRSVIENVVKKQTVNTESPALIRKAISRQFTANRIETIKLRDIKIIRDKGKITIDARYEKRVALFYNIDAVVKFDDLLFELVPSVRDD